MVIEGREVMPHLGDIYNWTTQNIEITFDEDTSSWTSTTVTFAKPDGTVLLEMDTTNTQVTWSGSTLRVWLTQQNTKLFDEPYIIMQINFLYPRSGSLNERGATRVGYFNVFQNLKPEVYN